MDGVSGPLRWIIIATAIGFVGLLSVAGWAQMDMMHGGGMHGGGMDSARHRLVMQKGLPAAYAGKRNPLDASAANVAAGKHLYEQNCAVCHGTTGRGDGPAGKSLNPPPANIAATVHTPIASDAFLYWTIAEGGAPAGSVMPPFKGALKAKQIWQLILYLRSL